MSETHGVFTSPAQLAKLVRLCMLVDRRLLINVVPLNNDPAAAMEALDLLAPINARLGASDNAPSVHVLRSDRNPELLHLNQKFQVLLFDTSAPSARLSTRVLVHVVASCSVQISLADAINAVESAIVDVSADWLDYAKTWLDECLQAAQIADTMTALMHSTVQYSQRHFDAIEIAGPIWERVTSSYTCLELSDVSDMVRLACGHAVLGKYSRIRVCDIVEAFLLTVWHTASFQGLARTSPELVAALNRVAGYLASARN